MSAARSFYLMNTVVGRNVSEAAGEMVGLVQQASVGGRAGVGLSAGGPASAVG